MRSFTLASAALALVASVHAGNIDNVQEAAVILDAAASLVGEHIITNKQTGKSLFFKRDDIVGTYLGAATAVRLQTDSYGDVTGTVISGTTDDTLKCLAAQWNFETGASGARDEYAVPYMCVVGSDGTGDGGIDTTKELWAFNKVSTTSDDDDDDSSSTTKEVLLAKVNVATTSKSTTTAASSDDDDDSSDSSDAPACDKSAVVSTDQTTWCCQHPGWWLARHSGYITEGGHIECKSTLAAYNAANRARMVRRGRHHQVAESLKKREVAKRSTTWYTITTTNHINDMATLNLAGKATTGYASTPAVLLVAADPTDDYQLWSVVKA